MVLLLYSQIRRQPLTTNEMSAVHFEEWFRDSLIPNLQSNSLIVLDNALYHSRMLESVPTMSSRKQQMHDWLTAKGIEYTESALEGTIPIGMCEQS